MPKGDNGGRPTKFDKKMYKQVTDLCLLGYSNVKLGAFFGVDHSTISVWAKNDPLFFKALQDGRENPDTKVARSLLERAVGYKTKEVVYEKTDKLITEIGTNGELKLTPELKRKVIVKHVPGDVNAQKYWLGNKAGWKDRHDVDMNANVATTNIEVSNEEAKKIKDDLENKY